LSDQKQIRSVNDNEVAHDQASQDNRATINNAAKAQAIVAAIKVRTKDGKK